MPIKPCVVNRKCQRWDRTPRWHPAGRTVPRQFASAGRAITISAGNTNNLSLRFKGSVTQGATTSVDLNCTAGFAGFKETIQICTTAKIA